MLRGHWGRPALSRSSMKGHEENHNKNPPLSLLCVRCLCSLLHHERGTCHPGVDAGQPCARPGGERGRRELRGRARRMEPGGGTPHTPFPETGCPGAPKLKATVSSYKSWSETFPCVAGATSVPFGCRTAPLVPKACWCPPSCPWSASSAPFAAPLSLEMPLVSGATPQDFFCGHRAPRLRSATWAGHSGLVPRRGQGRRFPRMALGFWARLLSGG